MRQNIESPFITDVTTPVFDEVNELLAGLRLPDVGSAAEIQDALKRLGRINELCREFIDEEPDEFIAENQEFPAIQEAYQRNLNRAEQATGAAANTARSALVACSRLLPYLVGTLLDRLNIGENGEPYKVGELSGGTKERMYRVLQL